MESKQISLLLREPFECLKDYGGSIEALKKQGKLAIANFDLALKQLNLQQLRDLLLILEGRDREGLALLPLARQYGNEVMLPRLAANIIFKIIYKLEHTMLSVGEIALLAHELITPRVTWSFEATIRHKLFKTFFATMRDKDKYASPSDIALVSAFVRKIALTSSSECCDLLLEIEELIHLKRLDIDAILVVHQMPKHNGVLVTE